MASVASHSAERESTEEQEPEDATALGTPRQSVGGRSDAEAEAELWTDGFESNAWEEELDAGSGILSDRAPGACSNVEVSSGLRASFEAHTESWLQELQTVVNAQVERTLHEREQLLDSRWNELREQRAQLERLRADLASQQAVLEREKTILCSARDLNEVLHLNVGGEVRCSVKRSTLCLVENSLLGRMFSGRWDESLVRDAEGRLHIDFPPDLFMPLIDYFRQKMIEDPAEPVPPPEVPQERHAAFRRMVKYYGLLETLWPSPEVHWEVAWGPILIEEEAQVCTPASTGTSYFAAAFVGGAGTSSGCRTWRFSVSKTCEEKPWCHDVVGFGLVSPQDERRVAAHVAAEHADPSPSQAGMTPRVTNFCRNLVILTLYGGRADSRRARAAGHVTPHTQNSIEVEVTLKGSQLTVSVDGSERGLVRPKPLRGSDLASCRLLVAMTYDWNCVRLLP